MIWSLAVLLALLFHFHVPSWWYLGGVLFLMWDVAAFLKLRKQNRTLKRALARKHQDYREMSRLAFNGPNYKNWEELHHAHTFRSSK